MYMNTFPLSYIANNRKNQFFNNTIAFFNGPIKYFQAIKNHISKNFNDMEKCSQYEYIF